MFDTQDEVVSSRVWLNAQNWQRKPGTIGDAYRALVDQCSLVSGLAVHMPADDRSLEIRLRGYIEELAMHCHCILRGDYDKDEEE